jgi:chromosome segregation ATPase
MNLLAITLDLNQNAIITTGTVISMAVGVYALYKSKLNKYTRAIEAREIESRTNISNGWKELYEITVKKLENITTTCHEEINLLRQKQIALEQENKSLFSSNQDLQALNNKWQLVKDRVDKLEDENRKLDEDNREWKELYKKVSKDYRRQKHRINNLRQMLFTLKEELGMKGINLDSLNDMIKQQTDEDEKEIKEDAEYQIKQRLQKGSYPYESDV